MGAPNVSTIETDTGADNDSPNIWYSFIGTGDPITLSTCTHTNYDSEILVFTGTSGNLTLIDEAFDECDPTGNRNYEVNVYLDDRITNTSTLLTNSDYVLTSGTDLNGNGRFFLKFSVSALSITASDFDTIKIYTKTTPRAIYIQGLLKEDTIATLYDINGRILNNSTLDSTTLQNKINASDLSEGTYTQFK